MGSARKTGRSMIKPPPSRSDGWWSTWSWSTTATSTDTTFCGYRGIGESQRPGSGLRAVARGHLSFECAPCRPIGVKRINGGMKRPFVIRGHKRSMRHPSPFRERGLGVRAKLPVSRTLKSRNCCDCARGTIRRANAVPSPQPRGRGWSTPALPAQFRRLMPMPCRPGLLQSTRMGR